METLVALPVYFRDHTSKAMLGAISQWFEVGSEQVLEAVVSFCDEVMSQKEEGINQTDTHYQKSTR